MKNVQTDRQTDEGTDVANCRVHVHVSLYPQTISGQRHKKISNLTAIFNDTYMYSSIYAICIYTCKLIVL